MRESKKARRFSHRNSGKVRGMHFFSKKHNFSVDKDMVGVYIGVEKGKKPKLSIGSDSLKIQELAKDFRTLRCGF